MSDLCVTITGKDGDAIRAARTAAEPDADLVELRLDTMERPDPDAALADRRKPAIVTCRPLREGGHFDGPEEARLRILSRAHELGAEFIDVEWDAQIQPLLDSRRGRGVIVSRHLFDSTPADPAAILADLRARGAEVAKLAVMTERIGDLPSLLHAVADDSSSILIGMGPSGVITRVLADRFGSRWTYAGAHVAPGQIPASRLLREFHFRRITRDTAVYGVLGRPVVNSLSPAMHNAGFAALRINAAYVPLETEDLRGLRAAADELDLRGASVTIPFKTDILPLLDEMTPEAQIAGAVNTIAVRDGRWIGTNTDSEGFLEPLRSRLPELADVRVVILGAGGAARGAAVALRRSGARVTISARRRDAARTVAAEVGAEAGEWPPPRGSWDLLVNATPVGSAASRGAVPFAGPFDGRLVYDLVYDPDPTEFMRRASLEGCSTLGGLDMLVAQAERQFEIWTGQRPPAGLFADAAHAAITSRRL